MNGFSDVQATLQDRQVRSLRAAGQVVASPASSLWALYRHRWNTRRALLELTDQELRDVGLDYRQARLEAAKPFWRE